MNTNVKSRVLSSRVAFMTRNIVQHDLSHCRDINRIIASRQNSANDYRAYVTRENLRESFCASKL